MLAGRYRLGQLIGRGGMADVYQVDDLGSDRVLALKRLRPLEDPAKHARSLELFEREFHTLSQVSHPRVVDACDYGVDGGVPYYTMELLDGGDLQERAPLEWQTACAIARDVCSVLSLLHSRRMLYRDMSPRNVRLTRAGLAKVIDFGAMAPMGLCKQVVGTAAFCPPEALQLQPLDARADLYSLGATLYYTLTGRRAYPARDFKQLRELWSRPPRRPSELTREIPEALDALVMSLLALDPAARPASAGEVMERLSAIACLAPDEGLAVSAAYLATPTLLARKKELGRIQRKIAGAARGQGGAAMIKGAPGVGRTRLLRAAALEAKLTGALVLHADAADAQTGDYGVVRALARQLLENAPEVTLEAAAEQLGVIAHVLPELAEGQTIELQLFEDADRLRATLQPALRRWFLGIAQRRGPLCLAIDDVDQIDEPSAAFVALLAYEATRRPLLVLTSVRGDAPPAQASLKLLAEGSAKIALDNLRFQDTEDLLRSIFGDVPHLRRLAARLHGLARGNPRDVMTLAQHLLDRGLVRYEAGAWSLPASIDAEELPSSMAQAMQVQLRGLGDDARELAQAMALCPDQRFAFDECLRLSSHRESRRLLRSLDRLLACDIVRLTAERYAIAHDSWIAALRGTLEAGTEKKLHARLAEVFERRGHGLRQAQHLLAAGEERRGLDALVAFAERSQRETDLSTEVYMELLRSLPNGWFECFEEGQRLCRRFGRTRREAFVLRQRQTSLQSSLSGATNTGPLAGLLEDMAEAGGLRLHAELDPSLPDAQRVTRALEQAQARFEQLPAHERVHDPKAAVAQLGRSMITAAGLVALGYDYELLRRVPLLGPYTAMSPALEVVDNLMRAVGDRLSGRSEAARTKYRKVLERLAQPDRAGLGASYHRHTLLGTSCAQALMEASMGLPGCLSAAADLEADLMYQVNAWQVRMIYHLWQGQTREAEYCQKQVELLKIQNSPRQWAEGSQLVGEVTAYAATGDLMRVKQTIDAIESLARRYPGWVPIEHYARGEYRRLRGDLGGALEAFEAGLGLTAAGGHGIWPQLAAGLLNCLNALGRSEEAVMRGQAMLAQAAERGLDYAAHPLRIALALCQMRAGALADAATTAQAVVDGLLAIGSTGIQLGMAYETRARIASAAKDEPAFQRYAGLCAEQYRASENPRLSARYDRLVEEAKKAELGVLLEIADAGGTLDTGTGTMASQVSGIMDGARGPKERAKRALELLIKGSGSRAGFLYLLVDETPSLTAQVAEQELPSQIEHLARESLLTEMRSQTVGHTMTATATATLEVEPDSDSLDLSAAWVSDDERRFRPVLLTHAGSEGFITIGLAVLLEDANRAFTYPAQLAADISRHVYDSGDVSGLTNGLHPG